MASSIVAIVYDTEDRAYTLRQELCESEEHGYITYDNSAALEKDAQGELHAHNNKERGVKRGAVTGGLVMLAIGALVGGPVGLMVVGGLGGALIGKMADKGVSKDFIQEVGAQLKPETSALFFIVPEESYGFAAAAAHKYGGTLYRSEIPEHVEDELRADIGKAEILSQIPPSIN
jgi:uncharacterized membrane protein